MLWSSIVRIVALGTCILCYRRFGTAYRFRLPGSRCLRTSMIVDIRSQVSEDDKNNSVETSNSEILQPEQSVVVRQIVWIGDERTLRQNCAVEPSVCVCVCAAQCRCGRSFNCAQLLSAVCESHVLELNLFTNPNKKPVFAQHC